MMELKSWTSAITGILLMGLLMAGCAAPAAMDGRTREPSYLNDPLLDDPQGWTLYMDSQGGG